jgi:hypothetical protein
MYGALLIAALGTAPVNAQQGTVKIGLRRHQRDTLPTQAAPGKAAGTETERSAGIIER